MQQRPELLEPLPSLFGNGWQPHPPLERVARVGVYADMLVVHGLAGALAIERDWRAREVHGASLRVDHDFDPAGIVRELRVERPRGGAEGIAPLQTGERAAHGRGSHEGLVAL